MSAVKSDKSNVNVANEDEDEDAWLYGVKLKSPSSYTTVTDDREEKAEDQEPCSTSAMSSPKEDNTNRVDTQAVQDEEESDDSDCDNFYVTIGEIKPGGSPQSIGSDHTPVQAEERMHAVVDSKSKGVDVGALGSIRRIPVLEPDVESFEEKPWNKPGADITDYFNYGFNEETWTAYCEKQRELRAAYESMISSSMDQKGRTGNRQKESWCDCPSSGSSYSSASRKSRDTDVTGDQTGSISRVEGRLGHSDEEHDVQVIPEGEKMTSLFPFNLSLPAPLPPPSDIGSAPPLIPPPPFPHHPGVPSPFLMHTLNTVFSGGCDCPPVPPFPFSTGAYPPMPKSMASLSGVIDSAKVWNYCTRHSREQDHNKGRDRSRGGGRDKDRDRGRDREKDHSPSVAHNSEEERNRHRDTTERRCDRRRGDKSSQDKNQRQGEWRGRHNEGRCKVSCSNERKRRRPGDDDEDKDVHDRHKRKNGKRRRGDRLSSTPQCQ